VICPGQFYKSDYVNQLCERHDVPVYRELSNALDFVLSL
jgi:hypothetical protein